MARRMVQQGDEPLHGSGGPENDRPEYGDKPHKFDNSSYSLDDVELTLQANGPQNEKEKKIGTSILMDDHYWRE